MQSYTHDIPKLFAELDTLGCQHVQIRSFADVLGLADCYAILEIGQHKSIAGIELIIRYETTCSNDMYVELVRSYPILTALTVYSAPSNCYVSVDRIDANPESYPVRKIRFTTQKVESELHCGVITEKYLTLPSVPVFFEAKSFNGCLNRKVSVDSHGRIKHCPSMLETYGNVRLHSLVDVVSGSAFKAKWGIAKDQIDKCRDCEFRYACSDCRAYLEEPQNPLSKPLKCGYDPYSGIWTDWSTDPLKEKAIKLYKAQLEPV